MAEQRVNITIPEGVAFDALHLSRNPQTGHVRFDWQPLERICEASGIDVSLLKEQHEDNVGGLIRSWYNHHLHNGGARDQVMDDLIAEDKVDQAIEIAQKDGRWRP